MSLTTVDVFIMHWRSHLFFLRGHPDNPHIITLAVKKDSLNLKRSCSTATPPEMFCSSVYLIRTGVASLIQSE